MQPSISCPSLNWRAHVRICLLLDVNDAILVFAPNMFEMGYDADLHINDAAAQSMTFSGRQVTGERAPITVQTHG